MASIASEDDITKFNSSLDTWEHRQGYNITQKDGFVCIDLYERTTIDILQKILEFSNGENRGQREFNLNFIKQNKINFTDGLKEQALKDAFVNSR